MVQVFGKAQCFDREVEPIGHVADRFIGITDLERAIASLTLSAAS